VPVVFCAIAPHGYPLIPVLSEDAEGALATRSAMVELGRRCAIAAPDVIVIAGPHGVRVDNAICLATVARAAGTLHWQHNAIEMNVPVDQGMTDGIVQTAQARDIPIALAAFAGHRRSKSILPLDWGTMVPLWFLGHGSDMKGHGDVLAAAPPTDIGPPVVIVTPSRLLPRAVLRDFGRAVVEAADRDGRRVAFVASCDWAHTHRDDGPFGYHPAAAEVDTLIVSAVRNGELAQLERLDEQVAEDAAIDGLWQVLMLAGVLDAIPMRHELLSYEAPTYYGMLVASYEPVPA